MTVGELNELLGRNLNDFEVRRLFRELGEHPRLLEEEDGTYYEFQQSGVSFLFDTEARLRAIHLYSEGRDKYTGYAGILPRGISFLDQAKDVKRRLGKPSRTGGAESSLLYGRVPQWLRYDYPDYSLHAEFSPLDGTVSLVTLITPDAVPR